jgi:hypothetical protein
MYNDVYDKIKQINNERYLAKKTFLMLVAIELVCIALYITGVSYPKWLHILIAIIVVSLAFPTTKLHNYVEQGEYLTRQRDKLLSWKSISIRMRPMYSHYVWPLSCGDYMLIRSREYDHEYYIELDKFGESLHVNFMGKNIVADDIDDLERKIDRRGGTLQATFDKYGNMKWQKAESNVYPSNFKYRLYRAEVICYNLIIVVACLPMYIFVIRYMVNKEV